MLVVAMAHFNRIGIAVAGTERIIPDYGIDPERMGLVYSAFLAVLHAGDVARRLVHRPFRSRGRRSWCWASARRSSSP